MINKVTQMNSDPRHLNEIYDTSSARAYLFEYAERLKSALQAVDGEMVDKARILIEGAAAEGRRIFAIGNGGSAAIADHLCCDWVKGAYAHGHPVIDSTSLSANVALYSAIANDFGFENVFSKQIQFLGSQGDVLVAISSSGNSKNIIAAVEAADERGMKTIGLSGFSGGLLKGAVDVSIHIDTRNYGIVEDAHQAVMHVLAQFIAANRDGRQGATFKNRKGEDT